MRRSVGVDLPVEEAFALFTRGVTSWWPVATHSIAGEDVREVVWEERAGGEAYEVAADGTRSRWATVVAWEPPSRLVLAWKVNPARPATEVEVRFAPFEDGKARPATPASDSQLRGRARDGPPQRPKPA